MGLCFVNILSIWRELSIRVFAYFLFPQKKLLSSLSQTSPPLVSNTGSIMMENSPWKNFLKKIEKSWASRIQKLFNLSCSMLLQYTILTWRIAARRSMGGNQGNPLFDLKVRPITANVHCCYRCSVYTRAGWSRYGLRWWLCTRSWQGGAWIGGCLEGGCQGRWEGCARVVDGKVTARVDV